MNLTTSLEFKLRELKNIRDNGRLNCVELAFNKFADGNLMLSRKYPVYIAGEPHAGKTELLFEILMQLSEKHGMKHFCYFGEAGNPEDIFAQLCEKYIGKPYSKIYHNGKFNNFAMTDTELDNAHQFVMNHFFILPIKENISIEEFYNQLALCEKEQCIKFDTATIDPVYELEDFEAQEKKINILLKKVNIECFKNNRIDFIINHTAETFKHFDVKTKKRIKHTAMADEWYGGKVWQRRAFLQILVTRPTPNTEPAEDEEFVPDNQTTIIVQKAKPKGIAKIGHYDLFYDYRRQRYYEIIQENLNKKAVFPNSCIFKNDIPQRDTQISDFKQTNLQAFKEEEEQDNSFMPF